MLGQNRQILLVEDDKVTQKIHTYFLEKLKFEVIIASTGESALNLVQKQDFCAIILDLGLPDMNGEQVLEQIRQEDADRAAPLFIIVVTAHGDLKILKKLQLDYNPAFIFTKPVTYLDFQAALQQFDISSEKEQ